MKEANFLSVPGASQLPKDDFKTYLSSESDIFAYSAFRNIGGFFAPCMGWRLDRKMCPLIHTILWEEEALPDPPGTVYNFVVLSLVVGGGRVVISVGV